MIAKDIMPTPSDYKMGKDVDFTLVNGEWIGPDDRKVYGRQEKMMLSNCADMVLDGHIKQPFDGKEYTYSKGEGGWFYVARNVLEVPVTTDSPVAKILAIDYLGGFLDNRAMHYLGVNDSVTIGIPEDATTKRFVVVADGTVVANETHNLTGIRVIRCRNPVSFVASTDSTLMILDVHSSP